MKIKEFSKLCGCNPKTLRYYDLEGLLKPIEVDEYSGYRYYSEDQALLFIKIKNLQKAGFTIEEIKNLIDKNDSEIFYAFERKIEEQNKKIEELKEIQNSYRTEIIEMKNKIEELQKLLLKTKESYDSKEEFGLSSDEYELKINKVSDLLDEIKNIKGYSKFEYVHRSDGEEESYFEDCLNKYETIFDMHKWEHFKDVYSKLPSLTDEYGYLLLLKVTEGKGDKTSYAGAVIGLMLDKLPDYPRIGCTIIDSKDSYNHFYLVRYKD